MKKAVIIYTAMGSLVNTMKSLLKEYFPDWDIVGIVEDSLMSDIIEKGQLTEKIKERLMLYFQAAANLKPEFILCSCSSIGEVAEYANSVLDTKVFRIDRFMIEKAVENYTRIGVLASVYSTMAPTCNLVKRTSERMGKKVSILGLIAEGAFQANMGGDSETHDRLILEAAQKMKNDVDVIILAQGSMAKLEKTIIEHTGLQVISSPELCIKSLAKMYAKESRA